jgi:hypothetical protein
LACNQLRKYSFLALATFVGSTEASNGHLACVGRIDRGILKVPSRLEVSCACVTGDPLTTIDNRIARGVPSRVGSAGGVTLPIRAAFDTMTRHIEDRGMHGDDGTGRA